jgi:hypothetical protein
MGSSENPGERRVSEAMPPMPADRVVNIADGRPAVTPHAVEPVSRFTVWLHRISLVIFVIFCIELGMLLAVLPWTPVWINNGFVANHPLLKSLLQENFVRGLVTGFGLVDIWIGIWEAVHYKDPAATSQ